MHILGVPLVVTTLTAGLEVSLCILLYVRRGYQRLPLFSAYVAVALANILVIGVVYLSFGFQSRVSFYAYWIASGVQIMARSFAIAELCRYKLRAYRGIWSLTCIVLLTLTVLFLTHASIDAYGQSYWIKSFVLTVERDLGITSAVILLAVLLIRNYYGLEFDAFPKQIAMGMCILCLVEAVGNTIMRQAILGYMQDWSHLRPLVDNIYTFWAGVHSAGFLISLGVWCFALRKTLPASAPDPVLLPVETYGQLSPQINFQLRAINQRLLEMLKP